MKRALIVLILSGCGPVVEAPTTESVRYFRVTPQRTALECTFGTRREAEGWGIVSSTGNMMVQARYDLSDRLLWAQASLRGADSARVEAVGTRATIAGPGREVQVVEVPVGVIVTSAPDWTDTFRICRLWNRARAGRQEFPGLWIHPVQPTQRLTFSAEFLRRDGELDVLTIRLRNNSPYRVWVDSSGRMIKLASLPVKDGSTVLVLEGFEAAATELPNE